MTALQLLFAAGLLACSPIDDRVPMFGATGEPFTPCAPNGEGEFETVVDGDTLDLQDGTRVRLLGVDTPEVHDVDEPECFGPEASAFLKETLDDVEELILGYDEDCDDAHGRTLAYVWFDEPVNEGEESDRIFLNELILSEGYATFFELDVELRRRDELMAAEAEARDAGRGLHGACE